MENEQAKKNFLIKVGVIASASLIFIFWFLNIKNVFLVNSPENNDSDISLTGLTEEIKETISSVSDEMEVILSKNQEPADSINNDLTRSIFEITQNNLPMEDKSGFAAAESTFSGDNSVSDNASQTAEISPFLNINNIIKAPVNPRNFSACPVYINCMPTIGGEARACQIPPGCEEVTQLVY